MQPNKWAYAIFIIVVPICFAIAMIWLIEALRIHEEPSQGYAAEENIHAKMELTFWNTWVNNEAWNEAIYKTIHEFEANHPDVRIRISAIPHDEYKIKVKAAAAGRELPDMLVVWPGAELKPLVAGSVLMPIDDLAEQYRDKLIPSGSLGDFAVNGRQYAIPLVVSYTSLIYYDRDLLSSLGYERFPGTYEQFKELIRKVRATGKVPIALGNKGKWVLQSCYLSTIGSRYTGNDFLRKALLGESKFTDPNFVSALQTIRELDEMGAFNENKNDLDDTAQQEMFIRGQSAMVISGSWAFSRISANMPKGRSFGVAVFPKVAIGKGDQTAVSGVTGQGIALNVNLSAEKRKAAIELLQAIYNESTYRSILKLKTLVPAKIEADADDPAFEQLFKLTGSGMAPVYDAVLPTELTDMINSSLQEMTVDRSLKPERLAAKLQSKLDAIRKEQYTRESAGGDERR